MQPLNGFRDFYPAECALRQAIFQRWRETVQRHGFAEYDGPPLEPLELYTKKSGDEIVQQLYNFVDRGERSVALRPEMTPTLARMVAARHRDFKKPIKWFSIPQVFRYERPQKGRLREHYQLNCDLIGEAGLGADIELIACLIEVLKQLGLTSEDFVIRISDRQFWIDFLRSHQIPEDRWYFYLQAIDKAEREKPEVTREKLGPLTDEVDRIFKEGAPSERLATVIQGLQQMGYSNEVAIDFRIVRGLAYYTGIVFEAFDRKGEFRAIAGGGRYDDLLKNLCGVDLPALGFGMGDVVLTELLKARGKTPELHDKIDDFVVIPDEAHRPASLALIRKLRESGRRVDYPLAPTKMGKQFELAEQRGATRALIADALLEQGRIQVKTLATREQVEIAITDLIKS